MGKGGVKGKDSCRIYCYAAGFGDDDCAAGFFSWQMVTTICLVAVV